MTVLVLSATPRRPWATRGVADATSALVPPVLLSGLHGTGQALSGREGLRSAGASGGRPVGGAAGVRRFAHRSHLLRIHGPTIASARDRAVRCRSGAARPDRGAA